MSLKTTGDEQTHFAHVVPSSKWKALGAPNSNSLTINNAERGLLKIEPSESNLNKGLKRYHKEWADELGNGVTRWAKVTKMCMLSDEHPNETFPWSGTLGGYEVSFSSPSEGSPLLICMDFDLAAFERLGTDAPSLLNDLKKRNFVIPSRTLHYMKTNSNEVKEAIRRGEFSIIAMHPQITNMDQFNSTLVSSFAKNCHNNAGEVCLNTLYDRDSPKVEFVRTQTLPKTKGGGIETTRGESIKELGGSSQLRSLASEALAKFHKGGFEEITEELNSNNSLTIKLVRWNKFDDLGRTLDERKCGVGRKKKTATKTTGKRKTMTEESEEEWVGSDDE